MLHVNDINNVISEYGLLTGEKRIENVDGQNICLLEIMLFENNISFIVPVGTDLNETTDIILNNYKKLLEKLIDDCNDEINYYKYKLKEIVKDTN